MSGSPLFSVVIPTYNRAELLRAALDSVFVQELGDFEVIVVDDGSDDATEHVVRRYGERVTLLRQENAGPGAARNLALEHARGRYAAFLDSDDLWFPWSLQAYAAAIARHDAPSFIAGRPLRFREAGELAAASAQPLQTRAFADYLASGDEWRWWGVSSFVVRMDQVRAVGGFARGRVNAEDADLALKLGISPGFVQILAPCTFGYREHAAGVTHDLDKTLAGTWMQVEAERAGRYPGGPARARERWRIATRHIRPVSMGCLARWRFREAWALYRATFWWNLRLLRLRYLLAFPPMLVLRRWARK